MQAYLAIFKRDASLHLFGIPPVVWCTIFVSLTFDNNGSGFLDVFWPIKELFFLTLSLVTTAIIVDNLGLSHSHSLAFTLPHFKRLQFNYSVGLSLVCAILFAWIIADSVNGFMVWLSTAILVVSLAFLLANTASFKWLAIVWLGAIFFATLSGSLDEKSLFGYRYSQLRMLIDQLNTEILLFFVLILSGLSVFNFYLGRCRYVKTKLELDSSLAPNTWKTMEMQKGLRTQQIQISNLLPKNVLNSIRKITHSLDAYVSFGQDNLALKQAVYGDQRQVNSAGSVWLMALVVSAFSLLSHFIFDRTDYAITAIMIYFSLLVLWCNIITALDYLRSKPTLAYLWLWTGSQDRKAYMTTLLLLLLKRLFMTVLVALVIVCAAALLIGGGRLSLTLMLIGIAILICGSLLQFTLTIWISQNFNYSMRTRQLVAWLTLFNFVILGGVTYYSVEGSYFYGISFIVFAIAVLTLNINSWRNNGLEFED